MELCRRIERLYEMTDIDQVQADRERAALLDAAARSPTESWSDDDFERCLGALDGTDEQDAARYRDLLSVATSEQAQRACELQARFGRRIDTLVLDIDETLRSATRNGNRIGPQTCYLLREFHDQGGTIIVCTGKSIGYVRGCLTQALGQAVLASDRFSIVYEAGAGVYTPSAGPATKQRLYDRIDDAVPTVFDRVQTTYLERIPDALRDRHHFEQKAFNVTLIPNADVKSAAAIEAIDRAASHLVAAVADVVARQTSHSRPAVVQHVAAADPELAAALERQPTAASGIDATEANGGIEGETTPTDGDPDPLLQSIEIGYYRGDAVELTAGALGKARGVRVAADTLSLETPFMLVMGDSKTDLEVMNAVTEADRGICAAPDHASDGVLDHCRDANGIVFDQGRAADALRIAFAYNILAEC